MRRAVDTASLYLNDRHVGEIQVHGWEGSWGFGSFQPNDEFSGFAPLFGRWSLLMHAADDERKLSEEASDELHHAELEIDALHARLFLAKSQQWRKIGQINIDGQLIEWKETWGER